MDKVYEQKLNDIIRPYVRAIIPVVLLISIGSRLTLYESTETIGLVMAVVGATIGGWCFGVYTERLRRLREKDGQMVMKETKEQ